MQNNADESEADLSSASSLIFNDQIDIKKRSNQFLVKKHYSSINNIMKV